MTTHQLTQKGRILASGTRQQVWTYIMRWYGHLTLRQFDNAGLVFEPARPLTAVENVIDIAKARAAKRGKR